MLSHGFSPNFMILGTMIPIPKDKKKSLCNSGNYRAIALSSIFSKILDCVILIKEEMTLCSSNLQFGFKKGTSTTQCTYSMLETIDHYNFMKSNAFVLMLDASKAFDRVNYCKLFRELLKREMSHLVLRLLLFMYTNQTLRVKWGSVMSESFTVMNGVNFSQTRRCTVSCIICCIYRWATIKITGKWNWVSHGWTQCRCSRLC